MYSTISVATDLSTELFNIYFLNALTIVYIFPLKRRNYIMGMNKFIVIGRLATGLELHFIQDGTAAVEY